MIEFVSSVILGAFLGSLLFPIVHNWGLRRHIQGVSNRVSAIEGSAGQGKKQANAEREELAVMEVLQAAQGGDVKEAIKKIGSKYPDVAMKYIKKLAKGGI